MCEECIQEAPCTAGMGLLGMGAGVETADCYKVGAGPRLEPVSPGF